ncbi:hypothetical protein GTH52_02925 [Clostridium tyrobutyricum]|uniref:Uncharacterized protein n=1 Tax=Clostridium tyrobutyricum DIVETGP TaxID=1408889 RepID=W6NDE2_CLOTY|nr:hypothetical protein [Clostridium tyrobutyricum]AND85190.1 hypothetical protein CTK_C19380 [Clostridium tyrobutyricum]ANP69748.1 hypothetical protein BA182_08690 [Clostridium tyrobutyricum]MBV4432891.1 hypothetical protein [Clostridium tyrobutyricum]QCH27169.1 hypothetical protein EZN00_00763 [Clostridium tyrobutyricum]QNB65887.1 hypothetical protein GTH52_02925 [Clostridium tyrobutyricum]
MRSSKNLELSREQIESILGKATTLPVFELRLICYAISEGGSVVISKKNMATITGTSYRNVHLAMKKVNFKGLAVLDKLEGTVYTLEVTA